MFKPNYRSLRNDREARKLERAERKRMKREQKKGVADEGQAAASETLAECKE
jgi:hypothetical protein